MAIEDHVLLQLVASVARIEAKLDAVDAGINGTASDPGLKQRVDDLESSRDKMRGVGIFGGIFLTIGEFLFHWITWHKGGK